MTTTPLRTQRLFVNIDHVATIRQARGGDEPDPITAAHTAVAAGAHGITAHVREDRRHVQDRDVERLMDELEVPFNFEMACTPELLALAERIRPAKVTLVPERRAEITTEGGLDLTGDTRSLAEGCRRMAAAGAQVSLFVAPNLTTMAQCRDLGVPAVELHTGEYAHHPGPGAQLAALQSAAAAAAGMGLIVHAGHGLTVRNVGPVATIPEIEELNIGHSIVSMAVLTGFGDAVRAMLDAMRAGRPGTR